MSLPFLNLSINPHENENSLHFQAGGTMPARFDVMLSLDNSVKRHIDGIRSAILFENATKVPFKPHISTISNIQVDARHAEAVKSVIEGEDFVRKLNERTASIFKDNVFRMQHDGYKIMGKDTEELKEAWYTVSLRAYSPSGTDEVDPALLAFRTSPMSFIFQGLLQKYPERYANLGEEEVTEKFLVVPEEDGKFSLILDKGMTTCYFRVPNYEVPLFYNRGGDTWNAPHVSLFRLKHVKGPTTSPTLKACIRANKKLADLKPNEEQNIINEVANAINTLKPNEEQNIINEVANAINTVNVPPLFFNGVGIARDALYCSFLNAR